MSVTVDTKPWHRQPLVWMLIMIPASAVVAGLFTAWLAFKTDDGLVADDYYWRGKQINLTLQRDERARELGLQGRLQLAPDSEWLRVRLQSQPGYRFPELLTFDFLHSTRGGLDQRVALRHVGDGLYQGLTPILAPGGWHLQLHTEQWRLLGQLFWPLQSDSEFELTASEVGR